MFRRRFTSAVLAAIGLMQLNHVAHAQCAFDGPTKARGLKTSMVRAYASCPGITFAAPNTSTMAGVPACAPPASLSTFKFGPKGQCKISMRANAEVPCGAPAFTAGCTNPRFSVKCSDVTDFGGTPISDPGWELSLVLRVTTDDEQNGDITIVDTPLGLAIPTAENGKLTLRAELNELLCLFDPCPTLSPCTSFEIISAHIRDPSGAVFATMGSSVR